MGDAGAIPRRILAGFLAMDALFAAVYAAMIRNGMTDTRLFRVFDLNRESNPPSWFAASQLLLVALAFYVLASRPFADHPRVRSVRGGFFGMGVLFTYLSLDEGGVVHERFSDLLGRAWYMPGLTGRGLVVAVLAVVGTVLLVYGVVRYLPRVSRLWPRHTVLFLIACAAIVAGGVVSEVVVKALGLHLTALAEMVEIGIEETTENVGSTLALFAVAMVLAEVSRDILSLALTAGAPTAEVAPELEAGEAGADQVVG